MRLIYLNKKCEQVEPNMVFSILLKLSNINMVMLVNNPIKKKICMLIQAKINEPNPFIVSFFVFFFL